MNFLLLFDQCRKCRTVVAKDILLDCSHLEIKRGLLDGTTGQVPEFRIQAYN